MNILLEELGKSSISKDFQRYFKTLSPQSCWEYLLYGISEKERTNGGRLRDKWLRNYSHLDSGGWWASGLDILSFEDSLWGCLKPNEPRVIEGKPIKYEHPPQVPTEAFFFGDADYWMGIIDNPKQPIILTEGAKKTASLLSAGFCAVGLPGIFAGYRSPKDDQGGKAGDSYLIPQLKAIAQKGREIVFCFDNDQKPKTIRNVQLAIERTAKLLRSEGCKVTVMAWGNEFPELKGIDDVHFHQGEESLDRIFAGRLTVTKWRQGGKPEPKPATKPDPTETNRPIEAKTARPLQTLKPMTQSVYSGSKNLNSKELLDFIQNNIAHRLRFNDLKSEILLDGGKLRFGTDIKFWFLDTFGEAATKEDIYDSLTYEAMKRAYNPVREYLEKCRKSPERVRIDNIASRYFGTTDPIFDRMVELWLLSAVARVYFPGCQADGTLILQGGQGKGKSTWFKTLAGEWFNDSIKDLENKDSLMILHSSWIIELSELDRITSKKQAGIIKHFLTQQEDSFRKPYGKEIEDNPRRAVFCGTVNPSRFLVDDENRRFWIIPLSDQIALLDRELLARERNGIWGEAAARLLSGETWEPTEEEKSRIAQVTKEFEDLDPWHETVEHWISHRPYISAYEVLTELFELLPGQVQKRDEIRVNKIFTRLGWNKETRREIGGKFRRVRLNPHFVNDGIAPHTKGETYQMNSNITGNYGKYGKSQSVQAFDVYRSSVSSPVLPVSKNDSLPDSEPVTSGNGKGTGKHETQSESGIYRLTGFTGKNPKSLPDSRNGFIYAVGDFLWWGEGKEPAMILEHPPVGPLRAARKYKCATDKQGEVWIKESDLHPLK